MLQEVTRQFCRGQNGDLLGSLTVVLSGRNNIVSTETIGVECQFSIVFGTVPFGYSTKLIFLSDGSTGMLLQT